MTEHNNVSQNQIDGLLDVMARLRDPDTGCKWDIEQTYATIAPYTIEEAYEVADAIDRGDMNDLKEELGDLLLQVVFHAQMAKEDGTFTFDDVVTTVTDKMISRHPHVFGDVNAKDADHVTEIWEQQKEAEKARKDGNAPSSVLDDVTMGLPAIKRAQKLQKKAAKTGFEWDHPAHVLDKFEEEIAEMREAIESGNQDEIIDELGDLFFVLTNFGRMLGADCEESLRHANNKFTRRFTGMERDSIAQDIDFVALSLEEKEKLWQLQKQKERRDKKRTG